MPLHRIGMGNDGGETRHQRNGLNHLVIERGILRRGVVRIQRQHRPCQFVHHVGAGSLENHILREVMGQAAAGGQNGLKVVQLVLVGQCTKHQKVSRLFKPKTIFRDKALNQILHVDATV